MLRLIIIINLHFYLVLKLMKDEIMMWINHLLKIKQMFEWEKAQAITKINFITLI